MLSNGCCPRFQQPATNWGTTNLIKSNAAGPGLFGFDETRKHNQLRIILQVLRTKKTQVGTCIHVTTGTFSKVFRLMRLQSLEHLTGKKMQNAT